MLLQCIYHERVLLRPSTVYDTGTSFCWVAAACTRSLQVVLHSGRCQQQGRPALLYQAAEKTSTYDPAAKSGRD